MSSDHPPTLDEDACDNSAGQREKKMATPHSTEEISIPVDTPPANLEIIDPTKKPLESETTDFLDTFYRSERDDTHENLQDDEPKTERRDSLPVDGTVRAFTTLFNAASRESPYSGLARSLLGGYVPRPDLPVGQAASETREAGISPVDQVASETPEPTSDIPAVEDETHVAGGHPGDVATEEDEATEEDDVWFDSDDGNSDGQGSNAGERLSNQLDRADLETSSTERIPDSSSYAQDTPVVLNSDGIEEALVQTIINVLRVFVRASQPYRSS
jgi:hypothetical protein